MSTSPRRVPRTIALDGPAAAGKSTVGRRLSEQLGHLYLDTGAIYRVLTLIALRDGVPMDDGDALAAAARACELRIAPADDPADPFGYVVLLDGKDVTRALRAREVDANVSAVSQHGPVRAVLMDRQREVATAQPVVMVGRDIGTVVLPDADLKIYLGASAEERSRRRYRERIAGGEPVRWADVLASTKRRDERDSTRAVAPLRPADDAVIVTTDGCDLEAVVAHLLALTARWPDDLTTNGGDAPCGSESSDPGDSAGLA